jgi:hypothetical protein
VPSPTQQVPIDEELKILEVKIKQLKMEYEHYFMGSRPSEPGYLRAEVQKTILRFASTPIKNTAARFRFNTINQRFQTFKRQWDTIGRQIDAGTYKRHVFKANLRDRERGLGEGKGGPGRKRGGVRGQSDTELFETYRDAAMACGQSVKGLTPERLRAVVRKQETALKKKLGCDKVNFRVVVEAGKVKLKASAAD